jgi:Tfp pilus assembly protein PilX
MVQHRERAGSALMAAVIVVGMVAVMSMAYLQLSLNKNREHKASVDAKRAFYIAEAGLSEAMISIASGNSGNVGSASVPARFGDGVFYVTATDEGNGKTTLTSTGMAGCGRSAISTVIDVKTQGVAALGVFSDGTVTIGKNALIDSFDSRQGSYASQHPALPPLLGAPTTSRVASNGDIIVHGTKSGGLLGSVLSTPTSIYGYVQPGPTGSVLRDGNVLITGSTAPSEKRIALPEIEVPSVRSAGDVTVTQHGPFSLSSGEFGYGTLKLATNTRTEIVGPANVVVNGLELAPQAQLTFDARNGPIRVYVQDHLDLQPGSSIVSTSQDPTAVALLISGGASADRNGDGIADPPVAIAAAGSFFGTMYAPNATITVPSTLAVYGAIAAKQIALQANAQVHFDLALIDSSASDTHVPQTIGWRIVPLPKTPLVELRLDILKLLQLQGIVAPLASSAHVPIGGSPHDGPLDVLENLLNLHGGPGPH